jgi:hypothetical protein
MGRLKTEPAQAVSDTLLNAVGQVTTQTEKHRAPAIRDTLPSSAESK